MDKRTLLLIVVLNAINIWIGIILITNSLDVYYFIDDEHDANRSLLMNEVDSSEEFRLKGSFGRQSLQRSFGNPDTMIQEANEKFAEGLGYVIDTNRANSELGAGAGGNVYYGYKGELNTGDKVAIKILIKNDENKVDYEINAKMAGKDIHHVGKTLAVAESDHYYIIIMELYGQLSFEKVLDKYAKTRNGHQMSNEDYNLAYQIPIYVVMSVADAMQNVETAFKKTGANFDIKPDNILLDEAGDVFVIDFGSYSTEIPDGMNQGKDIKVSPLWASGALLHDGQNINNIQVFDINALALTGLQALMMLDSGLYSKYLALQNELSEKITLPDQVRQREAFLSTAKQTAAQDFKGKPKIMKGLYRWLIRWAKYEENSEFRNKYTWESFGNSLDAKIGEWNAEIAKSDATGDHMIITDNHSSGRAAMTALLGYVNK